MVALFVAAACGGGSETAMLPADVGASLAAETAEVEEALAAGDNAVAREEAIDLRDRVTAAIDAGEIPESLQQPLVTAVRRLIASIPEDEAPPPPEEKDEEKDEDEEKEDEDDKDKGKGNDDKEGATSTDVTTLAETVTDGGGDG